MFSVSVSQSQWRAAPLPSLSCTVVLTATKHLVSLWINPLETTWLTKSISSFSQNHFVCHRLVVAVAFSVAFFFFLPLVLIEGLPFVRHWAKLLYILSHLILPTNLLGKYYSYSKICQLRLGEISTLPKVVKLCEGDGAGLQTQLNKKSLSSKLPCQMVSRALLVKH